MARSAPIIIRVNLQPFADAMAEAARRLTEAIEGMFKTPRRPVPVPPPHAFMAGDYDLRCRTFGCGKSPEEH